MKFILSRPGIILLALILILSSCLYIFYTTGVTGGRTGTDAVRDETPVKYYFYMFLYLIGLFCACSAYVYFILNPPELGKKLKVQGNEDEDEDEDEHRT